MRDEFKILIDMGLSPRWVPLFKEQGWKSFHWSQVGNPRATDREIMEWAWVHGYIVFTHDLDFGALLAVTSANGPSVIQVRTQNVSLESISQLIIKSIIQFQSELREGALISIDREKARARILPIGSRS